MELTVLLASVAVLFVQHVETSAIIEIRLLQYDLSNGTIASGNGGKVCCDAVPTSRGTCPPDKCDPYFFICVQDVRNNKGCHLGEMRTGYTSNKDHLRFTDTIGSSKTSNPIILHLNEYGGTAIPTVTVYDEDKSEGATQDDKIDYMQYVFLRQPDYNNNRTNVVPITMKGQVSSLKLEINVRCDAHFYGNDCKTYCIPGSDTYCDDKGKSVCIPGKPCDPNRTQPTPPPIPSTTSTTTSTTPATTVSSIITSVSANPVVTSPPIGSISTSKIISTVKATTQLIPRIPPVSQTTGKANTLKCHIINESGKPLVSLTQGSNISSLETRVISRLVQRLNVTASEITANPTVNSTINKESAYTLLFRHTGSGREVDQNLTRVVIQDICQNTMTRTGTPIDSGNSHTAVIAGTVSAAVLVSALTPLAFFLYKRKCRHSKVEDDETEQRAPVT